MALITRKPRPEAEAIYEPTQPYSGPHGTFNPGTRLRGSHAAVRANFGQWMLAELPDDEKARIRGEAMWGQSLAESAGRAPVRPPNAPRPSGRVRALGNWWIPDEDLGGPRPLNAGSVFAFDDPLVQRYWQCFGPLIEER